MSDYEARIREEPRSSEELVICYFAEGWETEAGGHAMAVIHHRGGRTEFELGQRLAGSGDAHERAAGADILGQLGWGNGAFHEESVDILIRLLDDPAAEVVASAGSSLGHRKDVRAIPTLLTRLAHPDEGVRFGVVMALSGLNHPDAISGLVQLSRDSDDQTRDWATFGLGTQTDFDSDELRDALVARLTDEDPEIRGEAMIGLARRGDERARPAIRAALEGPFYGNWHLEAVELLAGTEWIPLLERQRAGLEPEDVVDFGRDFDAAVEACRRIEVTAPSGGYVGGSSAG